MKRTILVFLTGLLFVACNRAELERVKSEMEDNIATAKRIEALQKQVQIDFRNARVFYEAMEKKLYVKEVKNGEDGNYFIVYSDGSELHFAKAETPVVSFGPDGEVIINGQPTGCKPVDGIDGTVPVISVDADGYYVVNGVKTALLKGEAGEDAETPVVWIDVDGYYCVGTGRVQPEICLKGEDGQPGKSPVPTIIKNDAENKFELLIDGQPTVPPTFVSPVNGVDGQPGVPGGNYIKDITISADNELIFTFSDGSTQKSSPVSFNDLSFELETNRITGISIGEPYKIKYSVRTDYAANAVSVNQMYGLEGWQVLVCQPDPVTKEGYVTVTAVGGTSISGTLMLMVIDEQQRTIVQQAELVLQDYRINIPADFSRSYVYDVFTPGGTKIAEVCREFLRNTAGGAVGTMSVVYPCDRTENVYGLGFLAANGGHIAHEGTYYEAGSNGPVSQVKLTSGVISNASGTMIQAIVRPKLLTDFDGNEYGIVKIGEYYCMAENLRVKHYHNGQRILSLASVQDMGNTGGYCHYSDDVKYDKVYGVLYNGAAVADNRLAPEGWHIPSGDEWSALGVAAGNGNRLKSAGQGTDAGAGEWLVGNVSGVGTNETGFSALPAGYRSGDYYRGLGSECRFWKGDAIGSVMLDNVQGDMLFPAVPASYDCYSVRCIKD